METREAAKRRAGESAAAAVTDGQVVGLGSGSTAAHAVRAIGRRVDSGLDVAGVATSFQSRELARELSIPLRGLDEVSRIDVAIDGADQVVVGDGGSDGIEGSGDAGIGDCIKGGGAAHAREKVIDAAADRLLLVVDPTKEVDVLDGPVPVEVLPDARTTVAERLRAAGGEPTLRDAERKSGPVVTDNGNLVFDCAFGRIDDPAGLAERLSVMPGVVEHGLFVGLADEVHVGREEGVGVYEV